MVRSTGSRHWRIRYSLLGVAGGMVLLGLGAALAWAPTRVRTRVDRGWQTLVDWLWPTRWAWALAAALTLIALFTPLARRRLPGVGQRIWAAIGLFVLLVVVASLATMSRTGAGLLALGIALAVVVGLVLFVPRRLAPDVPKEQLPSPRLRRDRLEVSDARTKLRNDVRTTILQAIAGVAVLAGAVLGFQQLTEDRRQATATQELTRQGQTGERFSRAIDQLGSDSIDIQLGGLYELEQLAVQESELEQLNRPETKAPERRLAIVEVVAAYIREHAKAPAITKEARRCPPQRALSRALPPPQNVTAALTILSRRTVELGDPPVDLRRVKFGRVNLTNVNLDRLALDGADLSQANLQGALLDRASLRNATFVRTNLRNASLRKVVLQGPLTTLSATLICADLTGADLREADLKGARLRDANLNGAKLQGAKLKGAKLEGAKLKGAIYDDTTSWPDGFKPEDAGVRFSRNP